ncbi:unnamed protein product, partial [Meganyctiphanes norvegica]
NSDNILSYADLMLFGSGNRRPRCRQRKRCTKKAGTCLRKGTCTGKSTRGCPGRKCTCCLPETTDPPAVEYGVCATNNPGAWDERPDPPDDWYCFGVEGCTCYVPPPQCRLSNCQYREDGHAGYLLGVCSTILLPPSMEWVNRGQQECADTCVCFTKMWQDFWRLEMGRAKYITCTSNTSPTRTSSGEKNSKIRGHTVLFYFEIRKKDKK